MEYKKLVGEGGGWHEISELQRKIVYKLCVLAFGAGMVFGLFVGVSF